MNYKTTALIALASSVSLLQAEIPLSEVLTIEGFVDASYGHADNELHTPAGEISESGNSFDVDQVEIDFLFDLGSLTARVDVQSWYLDDLEIEQAYFDYALGNGGVVSAGRYDSWLGFEAKEPTGLYQFSYAYDPELALDEPGPFGEILHDAGLHVFEGDFAAVTGSPMTRQNTGVRYAHTVGDGWVGISVQDGYLVEDGRLGGDSEGDLEGGQPSSRAVEIAAGYSISETLTAQIGGYAEDWNLGSGDTRLDGTNWGISGHLVHEQGNLTLAAELFYSEAMADIESIAATNVDADLSSYGGLVMANLALNEGNSVTGRLSYVDSEGDLDAGATSLIDGHIAQFYKATAAYNHAITANLLIVTEVSYVDGELFEQDYHSLLGAIEAIFTF